LKEEKKKAKIFSFPSSILQSGTFAKQKRDLYEKDLPPCFSEKLKHGLLSRLPIIHLVFS